jgi:hypothetical protein
MLCSKPILKMLYSNHVIYCSIRFIDTEVLYLPRVQSYPEILIDGYTPLKDRVLLRRKKVKIRNVIFISVHGTHSITEFQQSLNSFGHRIPAVTELIWSPNSNSH